MVHALAEPARAQGACRQRRLAASYRSSSGLVIASAVSSTLVLGLFFSPMLLLGFAINLALLFVVLGSVWSPIAAPG